MKKIAILIIVLISASLFYYFNSKKLEIIHPTVGPILESVYAISTVKSENNYTLRMGVLSSVQKYFVKEGDTVNPESKLLQFEGGTLFKSPISGIVTERPFGIKETITPQASIVKIVDINNLFLEASIEQMGALKILKGMKVIVSFEDFRKNSFVGIVRSVLPRDQDFLVQVDVEKLPKNILPGMSADLSIEIGQKENAITIPSKAISNGYITILKNKKLIKTKVEMGISDVENVEIISPVLVESDEIVIPKKEKL